MFGLEKIFCFHTAAKIQIISLVDETRETLITEQLTDTSLILRHETSLINFHTSSCVICDQTLTWFDLFSLLLSASLCSVITGASAALNYKHSLNKTCRSRLTDDYESIIDGTHLRWDEHHYRHSVVSFRLHSRLVAACSFRRPVLVRSRRFCGW